MVAGAVLERSHRFPGFGSVAIVSDPWMEVSLDGGPAEQTPVILPRVAAGRHVVTGQRAGYEPITMEVDVQMGETRKVGLAPQRAGASATP